MIDVSELAHHLEEAVVQGSGRAGIRGVTHDSRTVEEGDLFAVLRGLKADGRRFVDEAVRRGAAALLVDSPVPADVPQIIVPDVRRALGAAAAVCHGDPTQRLDVVAVTGTNGKTTVAYLAASVLRAAGANPGVMSTVEHRLGERRWPAGHTTPEATVIQQIAAEMVRREATHLIMEASSHGLMQHRLGGCRVQVAAFTNLTQDHLDYHGSMDAYGAAKLRLFTDVVAGNPAARGVVNLDDPFSSRIAEETSLPLLSVSVDPASAADVRPATAPDFGIDGVRAVVRVPGGEVEVTSPLIGAHNLSNALMALGIAVSLGVDAAVAAAALTCEGAPGRLERVASSLPFAVLVDYAHTPDALSNVLGSLRPLTAGRLVCVFGCGGDRDGAKRPMMGAAVRELADVAVVTSDNPRAEDPGRIIDMILPGIQGEEMPPIERAGLSAATRGFVVEPNRRAAIALAVDAARAGDTVLIAGKGHEDYQILGSETIHFDDREEAAAALERRGGV